jgi:CubicO group peptidase (beta-lactamase class C family)
MSTEFEKELVQLKRLLKIPGLSVQITEEGRSIFDRNYGWANTASNVKIKKSSLFPIASITKVFTSVLVMQLCEEGRVDLDDVVTDHLPLCGLSGDVRIRHLLSHSSEGVAGTLFNYSGSRFSILKSLIENIAPGGYYDLLSRRILQPLKLSDTVPLEESAIDVWGKRLVQPYNFESNNTKGKFEFGLTGSSGLMSSMNDLSIFFDALDAGHLLSTKYRSLLYSSYRANNGAILPHGYGFFVQHVEKTKILWAYGQEDSFSSLVVIVPTLKLRLIILANNNVVSDPARLIFGDISQCLFALIFFKNYAFKKRRTFRLNEFNRPATTGRKLRNLGIQRKSDRAMYVSALLGYISLCAFLGTKHPSKMNQAINLVKVFTGSIPGIRDLVILSTIHTFNLILENRRDELLETIFKEVTLTMRQKWPSNPYVTYYLAAQYVREGRRDLAADCFRLLVPLKGSIRNWYIIEACYFLAQYHREANKRVAREYYRQIINCNWSYCDILQKARQEIKAL